MAAFVASAEITDFLRLLAERDEILRKKLDLLLESSIQAKEVRVHAVDTVVGALSQDFQDIKLSLERVEYRIQRLIQLLE